MCDESGGQKIDVKTPVMSKNDRFAERNRELLLSRELLSLNFISSPGAGKTAVLEAMAKYFGSSMAVIEGDIQTRRDAERIITAGSPAFQIETGGACHLDAEAVNHALNHIDLSDNNLRLVAIENVGNLVCPAGYDLGEDITISILSVPEGDDKVLKYPSIFSRIDILLINKTDLLPYLDFDMNRAIDECKSLNPNVIVFTVSAKTGEGIAEFCSYLETGFSKSPSK